MKSLFSLLRVAAATATPVPLFALLVLAVIAPLSLARADVTPLSLDEAIEQALAQAPQLAAAAATLEGAQAIAPSAGRLPDPQLVTGVDNLPIDTADRFSLTRDFMTMRKIGVMQSFPNGEKRRLRDEHAQREIAVAQGELAKSRFETARATAEAWIMRAVADESLARVRELRPNTQLQASAARAAFASGRSSAADALAAQALVAGLDDRILALEQESDMRKAELARWVGNAAERSLAPIPTDLDVGHSMGSMLAAVPQHAPIAPLMAQIAAAQTDVALARAERRPDWSAEFDYAQRGPDFSNMVSLEFHIGLPLFAAHRQNPVIAEKLAAVRAQEAERDSEIRMHSAEVQAAFSEWSYGRARLQHYTAELLPLARDRTRAALTSYSAGHGDLRSAIEALTTEINAQLDYVQLQGAVARAWSFLHFLHETGAST